MFSKIMVPVDLAHLDAISRALEVAAALSKLHGAPIIYVGVFDKVPTSAARTREERVAQMRNLAQSEAQTRGFDAQNAQSLAIFSDDPGADLGAELLRAIDTLNIDLVVMGSHIPGWVEYLLSSNAGYIAAHAPVSVFVVR